MDAGVFTPFVDFDLGKPEIREIARHFGLSVADVPSESCLATRVPSGTEITVKRLSRIEDAESVLRSQGFCGGIMVTLPALRFNLVTPSGFGSCKKMWQPRLRGSDLIAWCFQGSGPGRCKCELPDSPQVFARCFPTSISSFDPVP
jgi:hypothetical protein